MVYQIIQDSVWHYIFGVGGFVLMLALALFLIWSRLSTRVTVWVFCTGFALIIAGAVGAFVVDHERGVQNDANFSKQLMDEYGVTSSQSLRAIQMDFNRFDEARTVFIKDGKEIPVYIKLVHSDEQQIEMAFTVIDEKSLFPKLTK